MLGALLLKGKIGKLKLCFLEFTRIQNVLFAEWQSHHYFSRRVAEAVLHRRVTVEESEEKGRSLQVLKRGALIRRSSAPWGS